MSKRETPYKNHMTNEMLQVCIQFEEEKERECLYCLDMLKKANRADKNSELPCITEEGVPVVWGAKLAIKNIRDYYYNRIQMARPYVSKEFIEKHKLYDKESI